MRSLIFFRTEIQKGGGGGGEKKSKSKGNFLIILENIKKKTKNQKPFFAPPPFLKVRTKNTFFQDLVFLKRILHTHKFWIFTKCFLSENCDYFFSFIQTIPKFYPFLILSGKSDVLC